MGRMKKSLLIGIVALFLIAGCILIFIQNDHIRQSRVMQSFISTYYSKDNQDIFPPAGDAKEVRQFFANAEKLYRALYDEKFSKTLTFNAYETLLANRKLFDPERAKKEFNCSIKLGKVSFTRAADTHDGRQSYEYTANLEVVFPDGSAQIIPETGSFILSKENNAWFIDHFYVRNELLLALRKVAGI